MMNRMFAVAQKQERQEKRACKERAVFMPFRISAGIVPEIMVSCP